MTTRNDYTDDEWQQLVTMPQLAAWGAMAAEEGGSATSTRELWAGMQELARAARTTYPGNALIQAVSRAITHREDGATLTAEEWHAGSPAALQYVVVEKTIATALKLREILAQRSTPEEAAQYAAWIMGIAHAGVEAAKTGFLGLRGAEVTPDEARFLRELAAALGVEE